MENMQLNTTFIILLVITLILFTVYYLIGSVEIEEDVKDLNHFTGAMHSFKVSHDKMCSHYPTKKVSGRYDDKYFNYLEGMHKSRDKTFMRGKVFLTESK